MKKLLAVFSLVQSMSCAVAAQPAEGMLVPAPAGGLPLPYERNTFEPANPVDEAYANYLRTTRMFPSVATCSAHLLRTLRQLRPSDKLPDPWYAKRTDLGANAPQSVELISNDWVTEPYLAWGGTRERGVQVGPLSSAFSLMESHLVYKTADGELKKATYACYVQYASRDETEIWLMGAVKYGAYLTAGHKKYTSGPAKSFGSAAPGFASKWDPQIRYYSN